MIKAFVVPSGSVDIFYTWWYEPLLATICFAIFINWYWYYERQYQVSTSSTFTSTLYWDFKNGPLFQSLLFYWIGIFMWTHIVPPASISIPHGIPYTIQDTLYVVLEVVLGIVYYDAIFFVIHWMMHEIPILRSIHIRHHDYNQIHQIPADRRYDSLSSTTTTVNNEIDSSTKLPSNRHPRDDTNDTNTTGSRKNQMECRQTLCHSLLDGTLQVLVNIIVQRNLLIPNILLYMLNGRTNNSVYSHYYYFGGCSWMVKSKLARTLHNIIVIWMLVESHSAAPVPYLWRKYCIGCREHYAHHHHYSHIPSVSSSISSSLTGSSSTRHMRYQQFFGYLDDIRLALLLHINN